MYELTNERPNTVVEPVQVPPDSGMGAGETRLFISLAERGYKPLMSGHWADDFETLPASLFTKVKNGKIPENEQGLVFKEKKGSEFDAIKALQELLTVGGRFRDCKMLKARTERIIHHAVQKYLRWAIKDGNLKISPEMIPVHMVGCQRGDEDTITIITRASKKLERLAKRHQDAHADFENPYWPTLLGFILCGPIFSIVSVDTDPKDARWSSTASDTPIKYLSYFDISDFDQDVWNSLAIAISILHIRDTMAQLANVYSGSLVPHFRAPGEDDTDDEDF
ncbi:hypothetical protein N7495_005207 [Penicillium taxi]|uniref:uncharacterized protein n=1 Tax=Penicillium taxi TaxID=168475 RepID=UPI0025458AD8|nr:uncharacterized protein N7495_005207 [Penicillium taxi]KAJ5893516.1 hypothetical protein N7495_005207 [Penicillium taxi]